MGEAKRRSDQGLPPRQTKPRQSSSGTSASTGERFVAITTRGAWIGIGALAVFWVTVRFIGPAAGWWTLADG